MQFIRALDARWTDRRGRLEVTFALELDCNGRGRACRRRRQHRRRARRGSSSSVVRRLTSFGPSASSWPPGFPSADDPLRRADVPLGWPTACDATPMPSSSSATRRSCCAPLEVRAAVERGHLPGPRRAQQGRDARHRRSRPSSGRATSGARVIYDVLPANSHVVCGR